jgi:hypothetical protein
VQGDHHEPAAGAFDLADRPFDERKTNESGDAMRKGIARAARTRRFTLVLVVGLMMPIAGFAMASSALAKEPTGIYSVFKQCPRFTAGVELCLYSETKSGEVTLNKQTVPIEKTVILQGGIKVNSETGAESFVGALNGETLSKTKQKVPGGLLGLVKCNEIKGEGLLEKAARAACEAVFENPPVYAVLELAKPASEIGINTSNLVNKEGVALSLPVKVHLENSFLGSECYIGSNSNPIVLNLTTGVTHPNPPNKPIEGKVGELTQKEAFNFIEITENTLVNNEFSAPEATGCGGIFAILIDPLINSKIGLPSPDGKNTAIQNNRIREATTEGVIGSEK